MVTRQLCLARFFTCSLGNAMVAIPLFDKRRGNCFLFKVAEHSLRALYRFC